MPDVNDTTPVEFRQIPWNHDYRVSACGRVQSCKSGKWRELKPWTNHAGYPVVDFHYENQRKHWFVHVLVLTIFGSPCPEGMECLHDDGNPLNSNLGNLRWGTHKENAEDMVRHGTSTRGERARHAKLTEEKVREIFALDEAGVTMGEIAPKYGVDFFTILKILNGKTWKHLGLYNERKFPRNSGARHGMAKLTTDQVHEILRLKSSGMSATDIAKLFGVSKSTTCRIIKGTSWSCLDK